jgi:hypothetical protein
MSLPTTPIVVSGNRTTLTILQQRRKPDLR